MFPHEETIHSIHIPHQWAFLDMAALQAAAGLLPTDVGKLALKLDDNTLWMLTSTLPTWKAVSSDGLPAHHVTHEAGGSDQDVNGGPFVFDHFNFDGNGNPTGAVYANGTNSVVDSFTWITVLNFAVFTTGSGFYNESDDPTSTWHDQWGGGDPEPSAAATQEEP